MVVAGAAARGAVTAAVVTVGAGVTAVVAGGAVTAGGAELCNNSRAATAQQGEESRVRELEEHHWRLIPLLSLIAMPTSLILFSRPCSQPHDLSSSSSSLVLAGHFLVGG